MARKTMTKEVTSTTVKIAKMETVEGKPTIVNLPDEVLIGNVTLEQAQKAITKKHGQGTNVYGIEADTKVYKMPVEKFIELAELVEDEDEVAVTE